MLERIEHPSGIVLSVKTFRPLLVFPWTASIWRRAPVPTAIATVAFKNKRDAEAGHRQLVVLLRKLEISPDIQELLKAIEEFAKSNAEIVKSFRVYSKHDGRRAPNSQNAERLHLFRRPACGPCPSVNH